MFFFFVSAELRRSSESDSRRMETLTSSLLYRSNESLQEREKERRQTMRQFNYLYEELAKPEPDPSEVCY